MDLSNILTIINTNKFAAGLAMILMNYGSRYILGDLTVVQESILKSEVAKQLVLFCVFFVSTRDILVSMMLTFAVKFVVFGLLNDQKQFNVIASLNNTNIYDKYKEMIEKVKPISIVEESIN